MALRRASREQLYPVNLFNTGRHLTFQRSFRARCSYQHSDFPRRRSAADRVSTERQGWRNSPAVCSPSESTAPCLRYLPLRNKCQLTAPIDLTSCLLIICNLNANVVTVKQLRRSIYCFRSVNRMGHTIKITYFVNYYDEFSRIQTHSLCTWTAEMMVNRALSMRSRCDG